MLCFYELIADKKITDGISEQIFLVITVGMSYSRCDGALLALLCVRLWKNPSCKSYRITWLVADSLITYIKVCKQYKSSKVNYLQLDLVISGLTTRFIELFHRPTNWTHRQNGKRSTMIRPYHIRLRKGCPQLSHRHGEASLCLGIIPCGNW